VQLRSIVALTVVLLTSACGLLLPSPAATCNPEQQTCGEVWVLVTGPAGWLAPRDYVLEIGGTGWPIEEGEGGGVVAVTFVENTRVAIRLVQPQTCQAAVGFSALAGSHWVIRFAADGTTTVEDWTGRPMDLGPALGQGQPSDCA
jgi:hypothetical protein